MNNDSKLIFEQYTNRNMQLIEEKKKLAKKDYDGDGKLETSEQEWKGSRAKAIAAAKGKKAQEDNEEDVEVTKNKPQYKGARAGKDIGQKGKWFGAIAKSAGKKYGSKEAGKRVAGAVLAKMRREGTEAENVCPACGSEDVEINNGEVTKCNSCEQVKDEGKQKPATGTPSKISNNPFLRGLKNRSN